MEENLKIKQILKDKLENKVFKSSFEDELDSWDDENDEFDEYTFKYYVEVGKVVGKGADIVASINVIIMDIQRNDEDFYQDWVKQKYNERTWYIHNFADIINTEDLFKYPFSVHTTIYGYDEYDKLSDDQKNL